MIQGDAVELLNLAAGPADFDLAWGVKFAAAKDMHWCGVFKTRRVTGFRDTLDGLSNTIIDGEIVCDAGRREIIAQPAPGRSPRVDGRRRGAGPRLANIERFARRNRAGPTPHRY